MIDKIVKVMALVGVFFAAALFMGAARIEMISSMVTIIESLTVNNDLTVSGKTDSLNVEGDAWISNNLICKSLKTNSDVFVIHNDDKTYNWHAFLPRGIIIIMPASMETPSGWAICDGTTYVMNKYDPTDQSITGTVSFTVPVLESRNIAYGGIYNSTEYKAIIRL